MVRQKSTTQAKASSKKVGPQVPSGLHVLAESYLTSAMGKKPRTGMINLWKRLKSAMEQDEASRKRFSWP
jgi:hypothetical protein